MEPVFLVIVLKKIAFSRAVLLSAAVCLMLVCSPDAHCQQQAEMVYIYSAPESATDVRSGYNLEILRSALEITKKKYGGYRMVKSVPMTEKRQIFELRKGSGLITVLCLTTTPELEQNLVKINIPVDKNVGGYLLLLVRKDRKDEFKQVSTLEDLKKFKFGTGYGWIDGDILRQNGFQVVTGTSYDGLFEMLVNRRFDVFLRTTSEILDEVKQRKAGMPDLFIEESVCIRAILPTYFWFSKDEEGRRLAGRVEEGMRQILSDGTLNEIFDRFHQSKVESLHLKDRKILDIHYHFQQPEIPVNDTRLWFDPKTYKPVNQRLHHD